MKLRNLFFVALSVVLFSACSGGANSEMCDCITSRLEMLKEGKAANESITDADKLKEEKTKIKEKYKAKNEKCNAFAKKAGEGLSADEKKKKQEELEKSCPAVQEMKDLMKVK